MSIYRSDNKLKINSRTEDLEFQVNDWRAYDYRPSNDDDDEDSDDVAKTPVWKEKKYVIDVYGFDRSGNSVCLTVTDFTPYFFVELPTGITETKVKRIVDIVKSKVERWNQKDMLGWKIVERMRFFGFTNNKKYLFLRMTFKTKSAFYSYKKQFETTIKVQNESINFKDSLYESNIDPMLRFIHLRKIESSGWIKVSKSKYTINDITHSKCNIDASCHWRQVEKSIEDTIGKVRILSFDIECTSIDGSFPKANREGDQIIQIGSTCHEYGSRECNFRHIVTLGNANPIEGAVVESYSTEKDVLAAWARLVERYDPDIIIGYNIFGFDWEYIYQRAKFGMGNNRKDYSEYLLSHLSRHKTQPAIYVEKQLSSSALGDNFLRYIDCPGRIPIDVLKLVQRDHKLDSYKLADVAQHFLGNTKLDLKPHEIFIKFQNGAPDDITEIAKYCLQDCVLCNELIIKLETISGSIAMANVCNVPTSYLFLRGQSVKIFSLVAKYCQEEGYLIKVKEKPKEASGYEGAICFPPEPQIWMEPIAVLDYNSLYPSSMISENLSHDTLVNNEEYLNLPDYNYNNITYDIYEGKGDNKKKVGVKTSIFAERKDGTKGILPRILMQLLLARKTTRAKAEYKTIYLKDSTNIIGGLKENETEYLINTEKQGLVKVLKTLVDKIEDTYNKFQKAILDGRQLAYKLTANSLYGQTGAPTSDIYDLDIAASTTATGRRLVILAKDKIEEKFTGAKVIYGDSVVGDTALILLNPITNQITIKTIENLFKENQWEPYQEFKAGDSNRKEKQQSKTKYHIWTSNGWSEINRVIRHKTQKKIYRVNTTQGSIDVTEDHSLLDPSGKILKPNDCQTGNKLMHGFPKIKLTQIAELSNQILDEESCISQFVYLKNKIQKVPGMRIKNKSIEIYDNSALGEITDVSYFRDTKMDEFVYDLETVTGNFHAGLGELIVKNTDSVFTNFMPYIISVYGKDLTDMQKLEKTLALGLEAEKYIGTFLKKPHNCGYEKIFCPFAIFSKKRYVANKYEFDLTKYKLSFMGIALKRRDNASIVKDIYTGIINKIFIERDKEGAKTFFKEHICNLLDGKVDIKSLVISKSLSGDYANPTTIAHKVLADRIGERDSGNKPQSSERVPYCYIDASKIPCEICGKKGLNINNCKCLKCLKLYCPLHISNHRKDCNTVCRFCRVSSKKIQLKECQICHAWYCATDMQKHMARNDKKLGIVVMDKCKKKVSPKLLQGDMIEHPDYIKEHNLAIDYRYYLEHQIMVPCLQIFELMMKDPMSLIRAAMRKDDNKKNNNQEITKWFGSASSESISNEDISNEYTSSKIKTIKKPKHDSSEEDDEESEFEYEGEVEIDNITDL
jgi:DNA polymerase elongation subunit (family B)